MLHVMDTRAARMEGLPLAVLLRAARNTYAAAIREPLGNAGFEDLPRNGVFVIGAISRSDAPLAEIIRWLGTSKQAAGQLVETLVVRGYLERSTDGADRRRLRVSLTRRGRAVAAIAREAVEEVDRLLLEKVGKQRLAHTRSTLMALAALSEPAISASSEHG